ncbi:hypothetical protein MHYP_G00219840 [Metynnis hypsauchen]
MVGQALQDYQEFHTISKPTRKDRENARLHKSHDTRQKYTTTSVKNMMLNARGFIAHVKAFHSEMSSLTNAQFDRILLQFKTLQKDNSRRIKAHQQTVKWNKSKLLRPSSNYGTFMHIAGYRVPRLTDMIRRRRRVNLFKLLQGYLAGHLGILTGHHPVVLTNLQKDKVLQAEVDDNNRALVWVDHHKIDRTFGNAYMALLPHEVDWLKVLIEVSTAHFGGEQCRFVFQFEG